MNQVEMYNIIVRDINKRKKKTIAKLELNDVEHSYTDKDFMDELESDTVTQDDIDRLIAHATEMPPYDEFYKYLDDLEEWKQTGEYDGKFHSCGCIWAAVYRHIHVDDEVIDIACAEGIDGCIPAALREAEKQ